MPFATSADILAVVASHLDSVHGNALRRQQNYRICCGMQACTGRELGSRFVEQCPRFLNRTIDNENDRNFTMILICLWISEPQSCCIVAFASLSSFSSLSLKPFQYFDMGIEEGKGRKNYFIGI
jgi:hypothetical protein